MKTKKSPSDPIYEHYVHDWARRVIARHFNINTKFMSSTEQWYKIVTVLADIPERLEYLEGVVSGTSI